MREIKFRYRYLDSRGKLKFMIATLEEIAEDREDLYEPKDFSGQYTGLKDKNGKEIYEGDIIKDNPRTELVVVRENVYISCLEIHLRYCYDGSNHKTIEVVGNIYENPELLK